LPVEIICPVGASSHGESAVRCVLGATTVAAIKVTFDGCAFEAVKLEPLIPKTSAATQSVPGLAT